MRLYEFDYNSFVEKLRMVKALIDRGATEGEKSAARLAYDRLVKSIAAKFGDEKAEQAKRAAEKPKEQPRSYYRAKPRSDDDYYGRGYDQGYKKDRESQKRKEKPKQDGWNETAHIYTDPDTGWTFQVLRFTDPNKGKRGSDKIWGYANNKAKPNQYVMFWGKYGKTVQTVKTNDFYEANKKWHQKLNKGYDYADLNPTDYGYLFVQARNW